MGHDQCSDQASADAPRSRVTELALVVGVRKGDVVGAGKVLPEVVRRAHLKREAVAHQTLERHRVHSAGESFSRRFLAAEHWYRKPVLRDRAVVAEDEENLV